MNICGLSCAKILGRNALTCGQTLCLYRANVENLPLLTVEAVQAGFIQHIRR